MSVRILPLTAPLSLLIVSMTNYLDDCDKAVRSPVEHNAIGVITP